MRILIISSFLPFPSIGGDRLRLASLLDWLVDSGHEVSFLLLQWDRFQREEVKQLRKRCEEVYIVDLRPLNRRLRHAFGLWGRQWLSQFQAGRQYLRKRALMQKLKTRPILRPIDASCPDRALKKVSRIIQGMPEKPQVAICEYLTTSRSFELDELSQSLKILDTLEVIHPRLAMLEKGLDPWMACSAAEESRCLARADVIMALQEEEREIFHQLAPGREVIAVGQPFTAKAVPQKKFFPSCLLLGTAHDVNLEGLRWFQKQVWPLVTQEIHSAKLLIAGTMGEHAFPEESVHVLGKVENVDEAYERAAVVAVPVFSGGNLKMKFLEALGKGKAVVATKHVALGIPNHKEVFLWSDDPMSFAGHLVTLLKDAELRRHFETQALAFAEEHLVRERVYFPLKTLLQRYKDSIARNSISWQDEDAALVA